MILPAKFPTSVWNELTAKHLSATDDINPTKEDWDQIAAEVAAVEHYLLDTVTLTAAGYVMTMADNGKTFFINNATGFVAATLPVPVVGMKFTFINILANTSGNHTIVTNASANIIKGNQNSVAGDAGDSGTSDDTISFVANQSTAGDKVELFSDGTSWFAYAISRVAAGMTFTTAS
jgi:hypothetical protein